MVRFLYFCLLFSGSALASAGESLRWFTDLPREFAPLLADPTEAQLKTGYILKGDRKSYLELDLGGQLGVLNKELSDAHFAVQGRAQVRSQFEFFSHSFDLQGTDYFGGVSVSYRKENLAFELLVGHESAHVGDDIQARTTKSPNNFSYESMRFLISRTEGAFRAYGGLQSIFRADPSALLWKPTFILGSEYRPFADWIAFYTALDCRFLGVHAYSPNLNFAVGYDLGDTNVTRRQRLQFEVYNGYSHLGQYFPAREFHFFFGILFAI